MIIKNDTIRALYSDDFSRFMSEAGLLEHFNNGDLCCRYCRQIITIDNLHALIPALESWEMCCTEPKCVVKFAEDGGGGR